MSKEIKSSDGLRRVVIYRSAASKLFSFDEYSLVTEDGDTHWTSTQVSGLYDSADAAEQAARLEIPWMREEKSN